MTTPLQQCKMQNEINRSWDILSQIEIYCVDIERATKTLLENVAESSAKSGNSPGFKDKDYIEETFTVPAAILISSLQAKKLATQRRIQDLLVCARNPSDESSNNKFAPPGIFPERDRTSDTKTDFSNLLSKVEALLTSINDHNKSATRKDNSQAGWQSSMCNMICKSPSNLFYKNGVWKSRFGGIDSDDPKSIYVVSLYRRLRKQCQNIVLLQKERDELLLENCLLREAIQEYQANDTTV